MILAVLALAGCPGKTATPEVQPPLVPTPSAASVSPSPAETPVPRSTHVPEKGLGTYSRTASGETGVFGIGGVLKRYCVQVEDGIDSFTAEEFAEVVDVVLADSRSWIAARKWMFQRIPSCAGANLRIKLTTPKNVDRFCASAGVNTAGQYSCRNGNDLFINLRRWTFGVKHFGSELETYRQMVINHEVGHYLGFGHVNCKSQGDLAPVMQQQSISLRGCEMNAYPYPDGVNYVG